MVLRIKSIIFTIVNKSGAEGTRELAIADHPVVCKPAIRWNATLIRGTLAPWLIGAYGDCRFVLDTLRIRGDVVASSVLDTLRVRGDVVASSVLDTLWVRRYVVASSVLVTLWVRGYVVVNSVLDTLWVRGYVVASSVSVPW